MKFLRIRFLITFIPFILLVGCLLENKEAQRGSVVENEVLTGILYTEAKIPAAGAKVKVFEVNHVPYQGLVKRSSDTSVVYSFTTDKNGKYSLSTLPPGQYNVFGELDDAYSYLDSLVIAKAPQPIPADTLKAPGSLSAQVLVEPNHDPRTVFIQLLGTNVFQNVDSTGRFKLGPLARGVYAIRIITTLANYVPYFGSVTIQSGKQQTLETPIRLTFTGIPVVKNLKVAYDTASEIAKLTWSPVHYDFLKEYLVYRTKVGSLTPALLPIARLNDTTFSDSLAESGLLGEPTLTGSEEKFEYQVVVRNKEQNEGSVFESDTVKATPAAFVRTEMTFSMIEGSDFLASIGDSIRLIVTWKNPSREGDSLTWFIGNDSKPFRTLKIKGKSGIDTLKMLAPSSAGIVNLKVISKDVAGSKWLGYTQVTVTQDPPHAKAGNDTTLTISDIANLHGDASQSFGKITKWEWDIGNHGVFRATSTGDTSFNVGARPATLLNILRVTDDDGNVDLDSMTVSVTLDPPTADAGADTEVTIADTVWLHANGLDKIGTIIKREWDIGAHGTFIEASKDTAIIAQAKEGYEICILRVTDDDGNSALDTVQITIRDDVPEVTLQVEYRMAFEGGGFRLSANTVDHGKIRKWEWAIGDSTTFSLGSSDTVFLPSQLPGTVLTCRVQVTDEDGNVGGDQKKILLTAWELNKPIPGTSQGGAFMKLMTVNEKLYAIGDYEYMKTEPFASVYDAKLGQWNKMTPLPIPAISGVLVSWQGSLLSIGGCIHGSSCVSTPNVYKYNFQFDEWRRLKDAPDICHPCTAAEIDGKIFISTGTALYSFDPNTGESVEVSHFYGTTTMANVNGKIYLAKYLNNQHVLTEYDPLKGTWRELANIPYEFANSSWVGFLGKIYLIGVDWDGSTKRTLEFDPSINKFSEKSPSLLPQALNQTAAVLNGMIFSVGNNGILQSYNPSRDP